MLFAWACIGTALASALVSPALASGAKDLLSRDVSVDVCGEVEAELKAPNLLDPRESISIGIISAYFHNLKAQRRG